MLGSLAGSALFPTQLPNGPRITDNRTTTSTVGEPVPILFGTADLAGTVMMLDKVVEHSQNQSSKGGPEQKTFSYTQSIAIGLCERVDDTADDAIGAIGGITRIWENGAIVYDIRPQLAANTATGQLAETDEQFANRLMVSANYAETFTLYLGDELQTADPTFEAVYGFGNVPPFRGLAYIVYPNRSLLLAQGQRHPNFTFECYEHGTGQCVSQPLTSNEVLYPWFNEGNAYTFIVGTLPHGTGSTPADGTIFPDLESAIDAAFIYTAVRQDVRMGYDVPISSGAGLGGPLVPLSGSVDIGASAAGVIVDPSIIQVNYNFVAPVDGVQEVQVNPGSGPSLYATPGKQWWSHSNAGSITDAGIVLTTAVSETVTAAFPPWDDPYQGGSRWTGFYWFETLQDLVMRMSRFPGAPTDPCAGLPLSPTNPGYGILPDGTITKCNHWVKDSSHTYNVLQSFGAGVGPVGHANYLTRHPLNPCLVSTDPRGDATFWTNAYNQAVIEGLMPPGLVFGVGYPVLQGFAYIVDQTICQGSGEPAKISDVILAICKRAGLTQVDVSDLADADARVPGYSISSICDAADIIAPLRSIAFFDCVESGDVMKFPIRGKEVVATFTEDDFGCFDDQGGGSTVPPSISVTRADETTLPRSIRLHYKAVSRDYQNGEADSPFRLTTLAVDDQDVSLPMCLDDVAAAQAAEVLWSDAWAAASAYELSVDQSWSELEGSDCIAVPINGVYQRLRIVSDSTASGILRKLQCVSDNEGSYISYAVASAPGYLPLPIKFISQSSYELLDLPCLQDADSDPGFYVAAQRLDGGGSWGGMTLYRSLDGGHTFSAYLSLVTEATMGVLEHAVPESQFYTWDNYTVINVVVPSADYTFESISDAAVLAGGNAAAIGADGRWEIVQFADATQVDPTHWTLSRLLRGRRGTEHLIGTSIVGDRFIMLVAGTLGRVVLQVSEIGATHNYKGVSIGSAYSTGIDTPFAGHGGALVPFWPSHLRAKFDTAGDIRISWLRRSRIGRTLMSGVDIPLGETIEKFEVDILDPASPSSPEIVLRTLIATNQEFVLYTAAMQSTDFGSGPLGSIKVAIYQDSSVVGRGTPRIDILTIEAL